MNHDSALESFRRQLQVEPDNPGLRRRYWIQLSRIYGQQGLELLYDAKKWSQGPILAQDAVIGRLALQIESDYQWLDTQFHSCQELSFRIAAFRHIKTGIVTHLIPGGLFVMGTEGGDANERPAHEVQIKPFFMGRLAVTQGQWEAGFEHSPDISRGDRRSWKGLFQRFLPVANAPRTPRSLDSRYFEGDELPIHGIAWNDIQSWLSMTQLGFRLPSEAEWEYACRGGTRSDYFWGHAMDPNYCWYDGNSEAHVHSTSSAPSRSNGFGLHDMLGNVLECVADEYFTDYQATPRNGESAGQSTGLWAVARGGCWSDSVQSCRSGDRRQISRELRSYFLGLRLAAALPEDFLRLR
jgi:formylglycine-generating enzyme required for sulfatase activity